ncbi:sulfotransferase family 2 domain-containing protein [Haloflavibacter putidus]|uniref:Sulfotransferase family protein n=1 Tax=Haloflavibacter putidus TaxID=2576776 RepID=A0A507ZBK9_9FLAO|nr:sulfotransferase family 2 domain-containing protein [Haloflavibacter putidus]TQD33813.1 sulfotransferase family protein [Haloflavibacter putidus]
MFLFTHIEKCAGTSFNRTLSLTFPGYVHVTRNHYGGNDFKNDLTHDEFKQLKKIWVSGIGGHSVRPYLSFLEIEKSFNITFLRNPIERYMSQFNHEREMGFSENIESFIAKDYTENFMVNKLAGCNDFNLAKKILNNYDFIGDANNYLKSISLLAAKMNVNFYGDGIKRNSRRQNENYLTYEDLSSTQQSVVLEQNKLDIDLYQDFILKDNYITKCQKYDFKKPSILRLKIIQKLDKIKRQKVNKIRRTQ